MIEFLQYPLALLVTLGVLVTFHELGHYVVARLSGVRVVRFSVGFGKPLWSRHDRHGTEWAVAAIPLGGYVRMLDEREPGVVEAERQPGDVSYNELSVGWRTAIAAKTRSPFLIASWCSGYCSKSSRKASVLILAESRITPSKSNMTALILIQMLKIFDPYPSG